VGGTINIGPIAKNEGSPVPTSVFSSEVKGQGHWTQKAEENDTYMSTYGWPAQARRRLRCQLQNIGLLDLVYCRRQRPSALLVI